MATIPVDLRVSEALDLGLRRHVEGVLGWQVVDAELRALVRPAVVLADRPADDLPEGVPVVQVVAADEDPATAAVVAAALAPAAVVVWPADRSGLAAAVDRARCAVVAGARPRARTVVAGGAGGVGTTTIALAISGCLAWDGERVLAVVRGDVPVPGVRLVEPAALRGPAAHAGATTVPAVPSLRVVAVPGDAPADVAVDAPPAVHLVIDAGVAPGVADVLVVRRDRAGRDAIASSPAGAIVLVDDGILAERDVLGAAGGRPVAVVSWSARVARATARSRVPAGLPGAWLSPLRDLVVPRPTRDGTDRRAFSTGAEIVRLPVRRDP